MSTLVGECILSKIYITPFESTKIVIISIFSNENNTFPWKRRLNFSYDISNAYIYQID